MPSSPVQITFCVDKGSTTPLPLSTEAEQVQTTQEEEPQNTSTKEVSEEGQISEQPQETFQEIEVRTIDSTDTKTPSTNLMQKERTLKRGDKGKGIGEQNPSSSKGKSWLENIPRWLRKEVIMNKKQQFTTEEEDRMELIEVQWYLDSPPKDA